MGSRGTRTRLGTQFGPYELQELLGMGGMGEVYRAYDTVRERTVALKLLRPDTAADPTFRERFRRESRLTARLQEPHVIPVHDFGEVDGVLYIDMRLVEGPSLRDELRNKGALPPARGAWIVRQVASALDAAHANGLVHRDIKPANVLLTPDDFAYLVDFGIAQGGGEASVTKTGLVMGSGAYIAPERLNGKPGSAASDVYSLTCVLFECLTGRAPYEGADLREVMNAHMVAAPPRPSLTKRGVNPAFDAVIAKGMAKDPADRYRSAGELGRAAADAAQGWPVPSAPPPPTARTRQLPVMNPPQSGYIAQSASQPPALAAEAPVEQPAVGRTHMALLVGTIAMLALAGVLAVAIVFTGGGSTESEPLTRLAPPSSATTSEPSQSASVTTTVTTTPTPKTTTPRTTAPTTTTTTSGAPIAGLSGTDGQGFVGHAARCETGDTLTAAIKTVSSLAVICETSSGSYYYHGERLRDGANVQLANAVPAGGGFNATNPADGAQYEVRPSGLTILSNGHVDSSEPALEYGSK